MVYFCAAFGADPLADRHHLAAVGQPGAHSDLAASVLRILHYGILGAGTAVATNCIGILRALLCRYNDRPWAKSRLWLAVLMGLYLASAAVTWQGAPSALLTFSMLCTTVALWVHDMRVTRFLYLLNSPPILLANLLLGSYSCAAIEVLALSSFALAVYRYDIRPARQGAAAKP